MQENQVLVWKELIFLIIVFRLNNFFKCLESQVAGIKLHAAQNNAAVPVAA